jgi:uncharacterized protein (TIGR00730 family)
MKLSSITVFCSSSDALASEYVAVASELGERIAKSGSSLVWGGSTSGLMGEVARSAQKFGGKVIGVIPESLQKLGLAFQDADEIIPVPDLATRKKIMSEKADAFVVLVGGFGTLEEVLEVLTLKQLGSHQKPIVFINSSDFFDDLNHMFEKMYALNVAKSEYRSMYFFAKNVDEALSYLESYQPTLLPKKWYDKKK